MKGSVSPPSPTIPHETKWRGHIDGLRAVSVLSVLCYHAGIKSVSGGFVGVDIFFVISGFLVSKVIYNEIVDTGRFSVLKFYERRIRRIIPAFVVVTALTIIVGGLLFLPGEFTQLGRSAIYSSAFAANIFFYLSASYFGPGANSQPLLHFWSLGVEEQFYITFPLVVLAVMRYAPGFLSAIIAGLALVSFASAEFSMFHDPTAAFYLTPQRAWELLAGSVLALPGVPYPTKRFVQEAIAVTGVALIIYPVFAFHAYSPFPGIKALAPVGGAALILWGCERGQTNVGAILGAWPLKNIGLWSYSIYMIHWPLNVYARQLWPAAGQWQIALVILLSVILGWLSFLFVETPFRGPRAALNRNKLFGATATSLAALAIAGTLVLINDGFAARLPANAKAMLAYRHYDVATLYRQGTCFLNANQNWMDENTTACLYPTPPAALLWGDSHAAHIYQPLAELFRSRGVELSQASASSCAPILGYTNPNNTVCPVFGNTIMEWISRHRPKVVILSAQWGVNDEVAKQIDATVGRLNEAGSLVVVIGNTPHYSEEVPNILAKRMLLGDLNTFDENNEVGAMQNTDNYLDKKYAGNENVIYISARRTLCMDTKCPLTVDQGIPIQLDKDHFSRAGAEFFIKRTFTADIVGRRLFERMTIRPSLGN